MTPVVVFAPTADGGHADYVRELLEGVLAATPGCDVTLVTSTAMPAAAAASAPYAVAPVLAPVAPRSAGARRWLLDRLDPRRRPEGQLVRWLARRGGRSVVHLQEANTAVLPWLVRRLRRAGHRVVATVHNVEPHAVPRRVPRSAYLRWQDRGWARCDALVAHTEANAQALRSRIGEGCPPVHVVPHGLWRVQHGGEPAQPPEILLFGVLRRTKGLEVLVDSLLRQPVGRRVVAGPLPDAGYADEVARQLARLPAGTVQHRAGWLDDVERDDLFARCSVVVLPYTAFEAQSGVLHLAAAHGRPVVVSDLGGMGDTVRELGLGLVVPPGDAAALADALASLLADDAALARARAGGQRAQDLLSWDRVGAQTVAVWRGIQLTP